MDDLDQELAARLEVLRGQGLLRVLRRSELPTSARCEIDGRALLNFSSNDYLGLANEPELREAAIRAIERYGAGSGAARLICGSIAPHHDLEEELAEFKDAEAAIAFGSGYAAAMGTIPALVGAGDVVVLDKLCHACLVDAARLSGARLRVCAHNDLNDLEDILKWADKRNAGKTGRRPRVLVVTESLFSMDGDAAPLKEIVGIKDRHGAWLMVDEAHATGLYGTHRRGLAEASGLSDRIEIQMGTLGKAIGSAGGFIVGSRMLVDYLINRARTFVFSTAPVPAASGAATAGIELIQSPAGEARCAHLWRLVEDTTRALAELLPGAVSNRTGGIPSAILPLMIGSAEKAVGVSNLLREHGLFIPAVRYPTVPRGTARLRLTFSAAHKVEDVDALLRVAASLRRSFEKG
jgi:8-amino-7-oxononanoate synthase